MRWHPGYGICCASFGAVCLPFRWHPGFAFGLHAPRFGLLAFSLASALCLRASRVAPVRGGTYFSLPPRNYSAVTRGETTNPAKPNASASISERFCLRK
ncbi:hypothetical protein, partial [Paraburkholderia hospita]|uniref:hypothetical protein n=1 Tax=Paraburkholderia hospita TaxID=169430 RepID=UPI001ABBF1E5